MRRLASISFPSAPGSVEASQPAFTAPTSCYDEDGESYQSICKIGTGFSEVILEVVHDAVQPYVVRRTAMSYYQVSDAMKFDVWFQAKHVGGVKAADLSISPVHKAAAGLVDPQKGIAD